MCKEPVMLWKLDVHWRCQRFFDEASTSLLLDDSESALISVSVQRLRLPNGVRSPSGMLNTVCLFGVTVKG